MSGKKLREWIRGPEAGAVWKKLYPPSPDPAARYAALVQGLLDSEDFAEKDGTRPAEGGIRLFSAPGRTELAGNHTDHNRGRVLAAAIQLDSAAAAVPRKDKRVFYRSAGYPDVAVDLGDLSPRKEELGKTEALIRGIAWGIAARGIPVGGFSANGDSTVLPGSGLSSSAAVEVLLGKIFDALYGAGKLSPLDLARIGQEAENRFFGKPCGLMDQAASAFGGAAAIDFSDPLAPRVRALSFEPEAGGYALCVVNTRGSHADLTADYAAIPAEMRAVAAFFGKEVLGELDEGALLSRIGELRRGAGDRAILRSLHFFSENRRVRAIEGILERLKAAGDLRERREALGPYLALINESGDSSWELLQNIYAPHDPAAQGIALALALTKAFLRGEGACRVHGGGFAGTIQAYIPLERLDPYRREMEGVFGEGALTPLRIRPLGAVEIGGEGCVV